MSEISSDKIQELYNYIEGVTLNTIHQHSPHTQDLLRFLRIAITKGPMIEFDTDFVGVEGKSFLLFDDEVDEFKLKVGMHWFNKFKAIKHGTRFRITLTRHDI